MSSKPFHNPLMMLLYHQSQYSSQLQVEVEGKAALCRETTKQEQNRPKYQSSLTWFLKITLINIFLKEDDLIDFY